MSRISPLMYARRAVLIPLLCAAATSLLAVAVWFAVSPQPPSLSAHVDMPQYTLEELVAVSDLVVQGTVRGVTLRTVDYGTSEVLEDADAGVPLVVRRVRVQTTLHGNSERTILVVVPDGTRLDLHGYSPALRRGQSVLLFLQDVSAPGLAGANVYSPVSWDNGIFDAIGAGAFTPRRPHLFGHAAYSLDDVRALTDGAAPEEPAPTRGRRR